jgi:hypothetical protein
MPMVELVLGLVACDADLVDVVTTMKSPVSMCGV